MRAVQITELTGPDSLTVADLPDPTRDHSLTPGQGVVIDVKAAGVSFPEVLQSRGQYQMKPDLPFIPGSEVSGTVRDAGEDSEFMPGDRVAAFTLLGGFSDTAVAPPHMTFRLHESLSFAQGAALILNYHTAYFALKMRGRLVDGERVLVHGAAGGVGTAAIQIAKGLGATVLAVVSGDEKAQIAREAGADHVVSSRGNWRDDVLELGSVDVVVDPVGGDRFTDSLRSLSEGGRLVVVGFAAGEIPEVKVNRLLLRNTEVIGAGWGAWVLSKPDVFREIGAAVDDLIESGHVRPIVGARFALERAPDALNLIDARRALGKVVLEV